MGTRPPMSLDSTQCFSSRVDNYVKYRPRYPHAVLEIVCRECGLTPAQVVADIGSGTGFLAELFVRHGNQVYGVEPNNEMREAGERLLADNPNFTIVNGRAEATTLPTGSIDLVVAGQAFHWFDRVATRNEVVRVLKPTGWVGLVWNERDTRSAFGAAYEKLLKEHCPESRRVDHRQINDAVFDEFFGAGNWRLWTCGYRQTFDYAGLRGRLLSSSYTPDRDQRGSQGLMQMG